MTRYALLALFVTLLPACAPDAPAPVEVPEWAKVAPEQIAEAKKHGVPVAFENEFGLRFVLIPAGTFMMGSPDDEEGRNDNETQHEVMISTPFYMSIYEVTNEQFRRFEHTHDSAQIWGMPLNDDIQPVVNVNWAVMAEFAIWAGQQDADREYALPSEEQWERACRAGATTRYSWGDDSDEAHLHANGYDSKTEGVLRRSWVAFRHDDGYRVTAPVGSYSANDWGIHDMHGNVGEWCKNEIPCAELIGRQSCRVVRGGCWRWSPNLLRSASRGGWPPERGNAFFGFRLVSPLPRKDE